MVASIAAPMRSPSATGVSLPESSPQLPPVSDSPATLARTSRVAHAAIKESSLRFLNSPYIAFIPSRVSTHPTVAPEGTNLQEYLYTFGDIGMDVRDAEDFVSAVQMAQGHSPTGFGLNQHAYAAVGLTSTFSLFTGYSAAHVGVNEVQAGARSGDNVAITSGVLSTLRGGLEILSGAVFTTFRVLSLIPSASAAALGGFGTAGIIGYTGVYLLMGATFSVAAHEARLFSDEFEKHAQESEDAAYSFLYNEVVFSPQDRAKALATVVEKPKKGLPLKEEAALVQAYKAMRYGKLDDPAWEIPPAMQEKMETLQKMVPDGFWAELEAKVKKTSYPGYERANMANALDVLCRIQEKRHTSIGRSVGSSVLSKLLNGGPNPSKEVRKALLTQARAKINKHFRMYVGLSAICFFGAVTFALSLVLTAGVPHVVVASMLVATGLIMTVIDGYFLHEALKNNVPKRWEKTMMWAMSLLLVGAGVAATCMSGGLAPMLIVGAVTALWLALYLYTKFQWEKPHGAHVRPDAALHHGTPGM